MKYTEGPIMIGGYDFEEIINNIISFIVAFVKAEVPALADLLKK